MRLLYRASPWRALFTGDFPSAFDGWPPVLAPLHDVLNAIGPTPSLAESHRWQADLVEALERLDLPAWRISQIISDHNDWRYRRAIELSLNEMQGQGWGPPPVAFCALTLGSVARHESLLGPDQDNAMILADYPDERHTEIDGYFQALGERFTQHLDMAGIPLCRGHVMARFPMWRKRLSEWGEQLALWTSDRHVKRVQQANILLDFHPVYGEAALSVALADRVARWVPRANLLLDEMADLLLETPVSLDRFGRLASGGASAPHEQAIDLKYRGILPLVNAVRLLSLRHAVTLPDTRSRLMALVMRDVLDTGHARALSMGLARLQGLLLAEQRMALAEGRTPDGWVNGTRLAEDERLLLRHDLQQIQAMIRRARG